jgi:hypothetical protein
MERAENEREGKRMPTGKESEIDRVPKHTMANVHLPKAPNIALVADDGADEAEEFFRESLDIEGDIRDVLFEPADERAQLHALASVLSERFYSWVGFNNLDLEIQTKSLLRFIGECIKSEGEN